MDLFSSFDNFNESVEKTVPTYSGLLGLALDGERQVEHRTRNGFVYVRLRDNLSEVVQAFNDKVSPVYDLPVVVERRENRWFVVGRDTVRYSNWGTSAPFLPKHGFQHSFDRENGTGGDTVLVFPDQFMPLLVYPSGTLGSGNLQVAPYLLQRDSDFIYVGNTGTANLLGYKPTGSSAIMGLVYLNRDTGNPGFLIASGSSFAGTITGTAGVSPFIPYPASNQEPLYAFRLVSGTESLTWDNLYNARQFVGGGGSSTSTGSSLGTYTGNRVLVTNASGTVGTDNELYYDGINNVLILGDSSILPVAAGQDTIWNVKDGASPANLLVSYGSGFAPFITGFMADGSYASPTNVKSDYALFRLRARGYDGGTWSPTQGEIRFVGGGNWASGAHPLDIEFHVTPTGSTTLTKIQTLRHDGVVYLADVARLSADNGGAFLRNMERDLVLQDGESLGVATYVNTNGFDIIMSGDSELVFI